MNNLIYQICDVGGTKSERKKWVHYYEDVNIIIFLVDISAYDRDSYEGNTMTETLEIWDSVYNSHRFDATSMVLFFNKVDLLGPKLANSPIDKYFPNFKGDTLDVEAVKAYIAARFVDLSKRPKENIQVYFTEMADNTSLGKTAFAAIEACMKLEEGRISGST